MYLFILVEIHNYKSYGRKFKFNKHVSGNERMDVDTEGDYDRYYINRSTVSSLNMRSKVYEIIMGV